MAALNEGNIQRARDILDANRDLIGKDPLGTQTPGWTDGIGKFI